MDTVRHTRGHDGANAQHRRCRERFREGPKAGARTRQLAPAAHLHFNLSHAPASDPQLDDFTASCKADAGRYESDFQGKIIAELANQGITDQKIQPTNVQWQTEFANEFNVDAIADVVTSALDAAGTVMAQSPGGKPTIAAATSKESMESYTAVVQSLAASLRSSESSRSDWAFQMTQIGAGLWGCVAAMNASLKNEDTFGSSAVSVTSFIYTTVWSVQACEQMTDFADEKIRLQSKLERHQNAANTIAVFSKAETDAATNFAAGKMSYKLYKKLFKQCEQSIAEQQAILDANDIQGVSLLAVRHSLAKQHSAQLRIIQTILTTPSNSIDETEGLTQRCRPTTRRNRGGCFGLCVASSVADSVADAATPTRTA